MDTRRAFIATAGTLLHAFTELACYKLVGNTISMAVLSVHEVHKDQYQGAHPPAIQAIKQVGPGEYRGFVQLFHESSIIIVYSWLDSFLSELEEALYLHDPASLGESVQIKLGKVLAADSIDEIVHDIAKRKSREKSQWGLKNRIAELRERYSLKLSVSDKSLEWMSETRNSLVHNRRIGQYRAARGNVHYENAERFRLKSREQTDQFLHLAFELLGSLYVEGAKAMGVTARFPKHRRNLELISTISAPFAP